MPIYEYKCNKCKYQFERIIMKASDEIIKCPNCSTPVKRVPTAGSFRFGEFLNHPNEPDRVQEDVQKRKERRTIK